MLADLNADGSINYTLTEKSGASLKLMTALLTAKAECLPVPDGATTLVLLGSALGGLNLVSRRSAKRS